MKSPTKVGNILDFFPRHLTPRTSQIEVLNEVARKFDESDVIVLNLPVAFGKSAAAQTIVRWAMSQKMMKSRTLTPTNLLVAQYLKDYPHLHSLPSAHSFTCVNSIKTNLETGIKTSHSCGKEKTRGEKVYCSGCPYLKEKKKGYAYPYGVYNLYTYVANQYYRPLLVIDEAHNVLQTLRDLTAKKYWHSEYGFPSSIRTYGQLHEWVRRSIDSFSGSKRVKLELLLRELEGNRTRYVVQKGVELLRGEEQDCIKLLPVDVRSAGGILWPQGKVQKLILMSATFNRLDVESLGLDKRRVTFISAPSAIPKERRPLIVDKSDINLAAKKQHEHVPRLVQYLKERLAQHATEKGLIHVTYSLMGQLKLLLHDERLIFHTRENKKEKYDEFIKSSEPKVLVAAGLYEGIDLPGDLGRWQVITKVPFPSLESPAIQWMAESNPEWFANETIRTLAQAYGRVCRTETDFGRSYIVDSCFERLYADNRALFPEWFVEGLEQ